MCCASVRLRRGMRSVSAGASLTTGSAMARALPLPDIPFAQASPLPGFEYADFAERASGEGLCPGPGARPLDFSPSPVDNEEQRAAIACFLIPSRGEVKSA